MFSCIRSCRIIGTGAGLGASAALQRRTGAATVRLGNLLPGRRSVFVYVECGSSGTHGCALHIKLKTPAFIGLTCSVCTVQFIFKYTLV